MPLYEYQCTACGHRFEKIQKFSDDPVKKCPKCGKAVERLLSSPAIQFKGTGWYVTDYAKRSSPLDEKPDSKSSKETPSDTKADSGKAKSADKSKDTNAPAASSPSKS